MKKVAIGVGVVLAVLVVAALIVPSFVDWNRYRAQITELAGNATGRAVTIGGDVAFRILPSPSLSVADVSLANIDGGTAPALLSLGRLEVDVALRPLIAGDLQVRRVVLDRPVVALEQLADGRVNWAFTPDRQPPADAQAGGRRDISLDRFVVREGVVTYVDAATGRVERLDAIDASLSAGSLSGPFTAKGTLRVRDVPVGFDLSVARLVDGRRSPAKVSLTLPSAGTQAELSGTVTPGPSPAAAGRLKARGDSLGTLVEVLSQLAGLAARTPVGLDQTFEIDARLDGSADGGSIKTTGLYVGRTGGSFEGEVTLGETVAGKARLALSSVRLEDWLPTPAEGEDARSPSEGEALDDAAPAFSLPDGIAADMALSIDAVEYGDGLARQVTVDATLADGVLTLSRAQALLPGGSDLSLAGQLRAADGRPLFEGDVRTVSNNLRGLAGWLGVDLTGVPDGRATTFNLAGRLRATDRVVQIYGIDGQFDISRLAGGLSVGLAGRPAFSVDATVDRLTLDHYLAADAETAEPVPWSRTVASIKQALRPLAGVDAGVKLAVDQLTVDGAAARSVLVDATLVDGRLSVAELSTANLRGLRAAVSGTMEGFDAEPAFDLTLDLASRDLGPLTRWLDTTLPVGTAALGATSLAGDVRGGFDAVTVDLAGTGLDGTFTLKGRLDGLEPAPRTVDLALSIRHDDHTDLFRRLELDVATEGRGRPVDLAATVTGRPDAFDGAVGGRLFGGEMTAEGRIDTSGAEPRLSATVEASHPELVALLRTFDPGYRAAEAAMGPMRLSATIDRAEGVTTVTDLSALLGPARLAGTVRVDETGAKPVATADLKAGDLPIDAFLPPVDTGAREARASSERRWSRAPLDLGVLGRLDGQATVRADRISYADYRFTAATLTAAVKDSVLTVEDLQGRLFGGAAQLTASLDARDVPALDMSVTLSDARLDDALDALIAFAPATGPINLDGRFTARGASQHALVSSLDGTTTVTARAGTLRFLNVAGLARQMTQAQSGAAFAQALGATFRQGTTQFNALDAALTIDDGLVNAERFAILGAWGDMTLTGTLDLPAWLIDVSGALSLVDPEGAPPVPFEWAGNLSAPQSNWRTQLVQRFVLQRIQSQFLGQALGREGGGLTDLTGRGDGQQEPSDTPADSGRPQPEESRLRGFFDVIDQLGEQQRDEPSGGERTDGQPQR